MTNIVSGIRSIQDYQRAAEEFELKKKLREAQIQEAQFKMKNPQYGQQLPAAMQLANEYQRRMNAGDVQGANLLSQFAKTVDKGIAVNPEGTYQSMPGYGEAIGSIGAQKKGMERQAEKNIDLEMNPKITRAEADQRNTSELNFTGPITNQKKAAEIAADQAGKLSDKADKANAMGDLATRAKLILESGAPTGSYAGAVGAFGKKLVGISDASTQANADLDVIAAQLTNNVPRMEGPQSDADRIFYQQAAGRVGDKTLPIGDRLSALNTINSLNEKYTNVQTVQKNILNNAAGATPAEAAAAKADAFAASKRREETSFQLRKKGYTPEQINEYFSLKGL